MTSALVDRVGLGDRPVMVELLADLRSWRDEIEAARCLPSAVLGGMARAGLSRLCVPRRFGGTEIDPIGFMAAAEEVARVDASTAWCVWIYSSAPWFLSHAEDTTAQEVYADGPDALIASPLAPNGLAIPTPGGYRLSGRWPFASGSPAADWFLCRSVVAGAAPGQTRLMLVPSASVKRFDTWRTAGLCGTGSGDVAVDDVFVPWHHAIDFDAGERRWPEKLYGFPHRGLACVSAAIALGIARASLDELVDLATSKVPALGSGRLADRPLVQAKVARAEAELGAARAFLYSCVEDLWTTVALGCPVPGRQQALLRAAANHACRVAAGVVDVAYATAGSTAIYQSSQLQRSFRDIHVLTQHFFHSEDVDQMAGQVLLGVEDITTLRL